MVRPMYAGSGTEIKGSEYAGDLSRNADPV